MFKKFISTLTLALTALSLHTQTSFALPPNPPLELQEEGSSVGIPVFTLDCVGDNITCAHSGKTGTITIANEDNTGTASDTEVLYDNAGTVDGIAGCYFNGTQLVYADDFVARFGESTGTTTYYVDAYMDDATGEFTMSNSVGIADYTHGVASFKWESPLGLPMTYTTFDSSLAVPRVVIGAGGFSGSDSLIGNMEVPYFGSSQPVDVGSSGITGTFILGDDLTTGTAGYDIYLNNGFAGDLFSKLLFEGSGGSGKLALWAVDNGITPAVDGGFVKTTEDLNLDAGSSRNVCVWSNGSKVYELPSTIGTAGQCLKTDGSLSWYYDSCGSGSPGGSDTEIQWNNSGAFGGISTLTTDGTNLTLNGGDLAVEDNDEVTFGDSQDWSFSFDAAGSGNMEIVPISKTTSSLQVEAEVFTDLADSSVRNFFGQQTDAGAVGVQVEYYHNSASPVANDLMGQILFTGKDDTGTKTEYASISVEPASVTNTLEIGNVTFSAYDYTAGALVKYLGAFGGDGVNLSGVYMGDIDGAQYMRILGDTDASGNPAGSIDFIGSGAALLTRTNAYAFKHFNTSAGLGFISGADSGFQWFDTAGSVLFNLGVGAPDLRIYTSGRGVDAGSAAQALNFGGTNAGAMGYGNATNTTAHTFTTDGTGNSEIVLPNDSIGEDELDLDNIAFNPVFSGYDSTGGTSVTTAATVNIDATMETARAGYYTLASDEVELLVDGTYVINGRVSIDNSHASVRSTSSCWIEDDSSASFVEIAGSRGFAYHRIAADGEGTCMADAVFIATAGDKVRLRTIRYGSAGTLTTIQNASKLIITRVGG